MIGELGHDTDDFAVLSIGTGSAVRDMCKRPLKEGHWRWGMLE